MALVNLLRFSPHAGGIVADEEFWNIFFRRRQHGDNLHGLLTAEMADEWGMEVVLGTVGYPAIHKEILNQVHADLSARHAEGRKPDGVREVARIAFDALQDAMRRRIDQRMRFWFDFVSDDLMQGAYTRDGQEVPIKNAKVKDLCLSLSKGGKRDALLKAAYEVRAAVFGYDPLYGITAFYLSPENSICGYVHEGFDCIGTGKYASGLSLGLDFNAKTLMMRKEGYSPGEGIFELLQASILALDHFKETGGTLHFILLDAEGKNRAERLREVLDEPARLCGEVVRAAMGELILRDEAMKILEDVVFKGVSLEKAEAALFRAASDGTALQFLLRGYKKNEAVQCAALVRGKGGTGKPSKAERGKKKKGA
ncbi:MAG: hypothetical protein ACYTHM_13295 [Planctomycetota bacterium]|jgi:hypothetical protein